MYVQTDTDGRITVTTPYEQYASEDMFEFDFPDDFDFATQNEYVIQNGELTYSPKPPTEADIAAEREAQRQGQIQLAMPMMVQANSASFTDEQALEIPLLFKVWTVGESYTQNEIIQHDGELYRIGQDHTSQAQWVPGSTGTTALYSHIEIGGDNYEVWKPWDGVSGIYQQDQIVHDPEDNNNLYISLIPNNTWGPPHSFPSLWELYDE